MARSFLLSSALLTLRAAAQTASPYTDDKSGITFNGYTHSSGMRLGLALPENPTTDFIGQIVAPVNETGGWGGFSVGSGMVGNLLIVAWSNGGDIVSSFRKATGYTSPPEITGDFSLSTIPDGTYTNATAFSYTFLCSNCIGGDGLLLSNTSNVFGWALSTDKVTDPTSASSALSYHSAGFGAFGFTVDEAKSTKYDTWAALASNSSGNSSTPGNPTTPIGGGGSSNGTTNGNSTVVTSNSTYDYIVAGGGVAGIIAAQRLAESGASVILLERGGASLASSGNMDALSWNSSITMYDVPGYAYYLSQAGKPALCTDTADQAGCLLGGGSMINALMFVRPQDSDFDDKWPEGWKTPDIAAAAKRVYERNPGQTYGSSDGLRYNNQAYDVLSSFLAGNGFKETDAIKNPNEKMDVFSYPPWNIVDGLRSGPVRTYLPLAQKLSNFKLQLNTNVVRAVRNGSHISGVETENSSTGERIIYNVKAGGRVILSAGAMSTPRILFNSGIGPSKQLQTVASGTSGVSLPAEADWIDLPVGTQIKDHVIFTIKFNTNIEMPSLAAADFITPNDTTVDLFAHSSGLLAQSGQRLNFWTAVNTTNGNQVFIQGTCNGPANNTIQMKVYLTHGLTSVGSLGITTDGATALTSEPWLQTDADIEAATTFMDRLLEMTRQQNSTLTYSGGSNVTGAELIKTHTTASHYVGTAKMGTKGDEGVVVDTDTKVYGTDNLFVVDASMHPDLPTGNTQAIVMIAAEAAVEKILALGKNANTAANSTALPSGIAASSGASWSSRSSVPTVNPPETARESFTADPTSTPTTTTAPGRGKQTHRPGHHPPHQSKGHKTSTAPRESVPTRMSASDPRSKRDVTGKFPITPHMLEDDATALQRSQAERASFLDTAYWS